jgi:hypothetical protein
VSKDGFFDWFKLDIKVPFLEEGLDYVGWPEDEEEDFEEYFEEYDFDEYEDFEEDEEEDD